MNRDLDFALTRGVARVEKEDELRRLLVAGGRGGRPLRVKLGFDPSRPDLTLGHGVVLRKLRQFQDLGHQAVVIVGDWTAQLGDPSGRAGAREPLTAEQVRANAQSYLDQFFAVVDQSRTEVRWQSEWFGAFTLADVFALGYEKTVAQMLKRDDFEKRFTNGNEIYIAEFLYPLLQGYDSVAVRADVELGGTDQTYNLLVGRELMAARGMPPQCIMTMKLIVGLDGVNKMSKSLGNYIMLTAEPHDLYGKLMSLPDESMMPYFETLTAVPEADLRDFAARMAAGALNPRDVKQRLAREIVAEFHDAAAAEAAEAAFTRQFQRAEWPAEMPEFPLAAPMPVARLLRAAMLTPSLAAARRLVEQGGVSFRPTGPTGPLERLSDPEALIPATPGGELKVGKLHYLRIVAP